MQCRYVCVNRLISDLYKKVGGHFYIKEFATYKPCLVMERNANSRAVLSFKFEYYLTPYTAGVVLSILKSTLA